MLVPSTVYLFNIPVLRNGLPEFLAHCQKRAENNMGGTYTFTNVHLLVQSRKNGPLKNAMLSSTFCLCDGKPLYWAAKLKGEPVTSRSPGPSFMPALLSLTANLRHGLIGGTSGQANEIVKKFNLTQSIIYEPPFRSFSPENAKQDWSEFLNKCPGQSTPPFVWVALGAPKQELWIQEVSKTAPHTQFFAVGAAFDFLSGEKNRAPKWMQEMGLEWFFRLCSEPRRLFWRYFSTNTLFLFHMTIEILKNRFKGKT